MTGLVRLGDYAQAANRRFRREIFDTLNSLGAARSVLSGSVPKTAFSHSLKDIRGTSTARGAAILNGRFGFSGHVLDDDDPFSQPMPSRRFALALHSFDWLRDLLACQDADAPAQAGHLVDCWIKHYARWNSFAWAPEISARRLINWSLAPAVFRDNPERIQALHRQARHLRRSIRHARPGLDRLRGGVALMLSGAVLDMDGLRQSGQRLLDTELPRQIQTDGGHISRAPSTAVEVLTLLTLIDTAEAHANRDTPEKISRAIDRIAPIVRFFRMGDGGLCSFHGGGEGDRRTIDHALAARDTGSRSFGFAPNSGYQRIEAGGAILVMDVGKPAQGVASASAHASTQAFELSAGGHRIVVNCGWTDEQPESWREAVRATAAHSTLTIEETSSARLIPRGWRRQLMGPRFEDQPVQVTARRNEEDIGTWLEASHDGYRETFGLLHRRRIFLAADGGDLRGEDGLYRPVEDGPPDEVDQRFRFAIRFHLHPDVKASLARDGMSALLVLGNGDGWRFRTDGGPVRIERSVYLASGGTPKRTSQIVVQSEAEPFGAGERPPNRVRWAFQRLGRVGGT
ncbi:heparinase II/III family protein [Hyphobacterium sp. HN65]|uniref:Heparinase II/III family protein n=1 Tax=Hyphobacterium lacteum TaxID=3116575 RepID=A0ABU7LRM6_9PROT|nr:heparinase II/III family protein [Hyphobacterium sp. HN65]MEE2526553.1 heparinase II/III family protein [Hyphobacterium sp. HN65]